MAEVMQRLVELEADVRYQELPSDGEPEFRYEPGQIPVLLSAPHGAVHTRLGQLKKEDEYTAGMARLVAELTGAHGLYARRRSTADPNWDTDIPYKKRLSRLSRRQAFALCSISTARPARATLGLRWAL